MAYTPDALVVNPSYGNLPISGENYKITGFIGSNPQSIDATGTPQNSPLTVNTTATIVVPQKALQCLLASPTTFQVSEDSTQTAFFNVPANIIYAVDCFRLPKIYLKTASSQVVSFQFRMLN